MISRLFDELQHRRVFRTLGGYAFVAWIAVEAADVIFPVFGVPESMLTGLIVLALAGFPVVAILTWIFDVTPEGIVVGTASPQSAAGLSRFAQVSSWLLVVVLGIAVAYLSNRLYLRSDGGPVFARGKSVAVLPFKNIAADDQSNAAYFSDGVAEEILSALSDVEGLRVAARTSSFAYRDDADIREVGEKIDAYLQLGRLDEAAKSLEHAQRVAPKNESVIQASVRILFAAGRSTELNTLTTERVQFAINTEGLADSKLHLERLVWGAIGRLSVNDTAGASEFLELALPATLKLDPHPQSIRGLALLARSRVLQGSDPAKIDAALQKGEAIAERVQAQGWGTGEVDYALASLAAAGGSIPEALAHLNAAVDHGWRDVLYANQDPVMAALHPTAEYQTLIRQFEAN